MQFNPKMFEARLSRDSVKLENGVFPFPPPTVEARVMQRPATLILASLTCKSSHSRDDDVMSSPSIVPLVMSIPKLNVPQPSIARTPVLTNVGLVSIVNKVRSNPVVEYLHANTQST